MDPQVNRAHKWILSAGARMFGTGNFRASTPDYDSSGTEESLGEVISARVERISAYSVEAPIPGANYYAMYGRRDLLLGDIVRPYPQSSNSITPPITVIMAEDGKDLHAVSTSRIGKIIVARGKIKFSNVAFDFVTQPPDATPAQSPEFEGSPTVMRQKAIFWAREGVENGWRLVDDASGTIYTITEIVVSGPLMIVTLFDHGGENE